MYYDMNKFKKKWVFYPQTCIVQWRTVYLFLHFGDFLKYFNTLNTNLQKNGHFNTNFIGYYGLYEVRKVQTGIKKERNLERVGKKKYGYAYKDISKFKRGNKRSI